MSDNHRHNGTTKDMFYYDFKGAPQNHQESLGVIHGDDHRPELQHQNVKKPAARRGGGESIKTINV